MHVGETEIEESIDIKWETEKHTRDEATNAFGNIEFRAVDMKTRAKVTHKIYELFSELVNISNIFISQYILQFLINRGQTSFNHHDFIMGC